jgi:uncharacterized membrane protein YdjX (TVP38/TMEM64 family)
MRYFSLFLGICLVLLLMFALVAAADVTFLTGTAWMSAYAAPTAAAIGNALLIADVLLPIPSSLLMVANGALLGVFWGSIATLVSATLAGMLAFWIGRRGSRLVSRFVAPHELERADHFFQRWGGAAVVLSRPVPIIAEAVGAVAGTTRLGWTKFTLALLLGNAPIAVLYAIAGASVDRVRYGSLIFFALLAAAGLWLLVSRSRAAGETRAGR